MPETSSGRPHHICVTLEPGSLWATFLCEAQAGASCRKGCPTGCETWPCEHDLVDTGACIPLEWMENGDWQELYDGDPQEPVSGPVEFIWTGDGYDWRYAEPPQDALPLVIQNGATDA